MLSRGTAGGGCRDPTGFLWRWVPSSWRGDTVRFFHLRVRVPPVPAVPVQHYYYYYYYYYKYLYYIYIGGFRPGTATGTTRIQAVPLL